ncbi:MAG: sugar O-acyltransferase (sialic acid O-acetyltransferase NeuD family) [Cyclobacteriaceae bacterium]|jgi:sugar O-acyltransferase (sialic acid O-acetyltransferase NeuD family)
MEKPVIIFGATGIARAALSIFKSNGIVVYGFLEENKTLHNTEIESIPVLGDPEDHGFLKLIGQKCEAFVATDDNDVRKKEVERLVKSRKVMPVNAIHESAFLSESVEIGHGNFINGQVFIGAGVKIGHHNILNSACTIDHEVEITNFVQVGAGTIINSRVTIGDNAFIGSGVTIVSGVKIGKKARIGAGSVVIQDVPAGATVFGNPAVKVS